MKIACILGSPRAKGNSAKLAEKFCDAARKKKATVNSFLINLMKYRGCQGCMACKGKADDCVVRDDLSPVLDAVREADLVVMASPVYYGDVTSQLKAFIDRMFCYLTTDYKSRLKPGKKLAMLLVQGDPDEKNFADIFGRYSEFFKWHGIESHLIRVCGDDNYQLEKGLEEAEKLADKLTR